MPKYLTRPIHISLTGDLLRETKHVTLPLPPSSPRHEGKFIVEKHPGDPRRQLVFWEPLRAKKMTPLEAAATVLFRLAEAARSDKALDLKSVFQKYDTDGGGSIDQEELGQVLKEFHILLDELELSQVFSIFDPDGGGEISYLEFVYAIFNRRAFIKKLENERERRKQAQGDDGKNHGITDPSVFKQTHGTTEEENSNEAYEYFLRTKRIKAAKAEAEKLQRAVDAVERKRRAANHREQTRKSSHQTMRHTYVPGAKCHENGGNGKREPTKQRIRCKHHPRGTSVLRTMVHANTALHHGTHLCRHYVDLFMNKHMLRVGDLFRFADERSLADILYVLFVYFFVLGRLVVV